MVQPTHDPLHPARVDMTLIELVERAGQGDSSAFEFLFQSYNARICTYLARMVGNDEEGRELAQETFLKAWQTLPSLHDGSRFGSWLYQIATNIALDHLRRKKFRWPSWKDALQQDLVSLTQSNGPEEQIAEGEQIKLSLKHVSPMYRACLLLQIESGYTQREIAELLEINEKNVSVNVRRGCEQFRQAYHQLEQGHVLTKRGRNR